VQNNNNNGGILKLSKSIPLTHPIVKKERLKKEIFNFLDHSDKELIMNNYNIFRALIFQHIVSPELVEK
jgi:hypothetical protein